MVHLASDHEHPEFQSQRNIEAHLLPDKLFLENSFWENKKETLFSN